MPVVTNDATVSEALKLPEVINHASCWKTYHLDEEKCALHVPPNPRVKNCRSNPYCIRRLGLDKFEKLKTQHSENSTSDLIRRDVDKEPCGLVNFGNFCYVNSFLQIWYNDLAFRQCVYDWRPHPSFVPPDGTKMDVQAVMNCIQELFLTMQFTPYETTNALELIRLLKLDNEQHDVQEFNMLFFDALDRNLEHHPNGENMRLVIQNQFGSTICQTIACENCGISNDTESEYRSLQLSIDGHNSLVSAIQSFFHPEKLTDYKCDGCGKSGCVTRFSRFTKLPPVLVIQLNRYVFDSNGRHKKLKTPIQYPRTLRTGVLKEDSDESVYDLCAVMIHEGPNTHCGHYYDLIRSPVNGQWFTYNDKQVAQTKPPGVQLEKESIQRASTDMKECYALIYQHSSANHGITVENIRYPPTELVADVQKKLNDKFCKESKEGNTSLNVWKEHVAARHEFLSKLWDDLEIENGKELRRTPSELAFLPTTLLSDILLKEFKAVEEMKALEEYDPPTENGSPSKAKEGSNDGSADGSCGGVSGNSTTGERKVVSNVIDAVYELDSLEETQMTLCAHERVSLDAVQKGEIKAVKRSAAEKLLRYYGIHSSLDSSLSTDDNMAQANIKDSVRSVNRMRSGADICIECVNLLRKEATFKKNLDATQDLSVMRAIKQRTHDPRRNVPEPEVKPPENTLWISEKHLRYLRKLALDQMEYSKRSNIKVMKKLVFSTNCERKKSVRSNNGLGGSSCSDGLRILRSRNDSTESSGASPAPSTSTQYSSCAPPPPSANINRKRKFSPISVDIKCLKISPPQSGMGAITGAGVMDDGQFSTSSTVLLNTSSASSAENDIDSSKNGSMALNGSDQDMGLKSEAENEGNYNENKQLKEENERGNSGGEEDDDVAADEDDDITEPITMMKKPARFNDELYCEHEALNYRVRRIWVTAEEWAIIQKNFAEFCEPILCTTPECALCVQDYNAVRIQQITCLSRLSDLMTAIGKELRAIERRKQWERGELGTLYTHVLCPTFIQRITRCFKNRKNGNVELPTMCQQCLLCEHHRPFMALDSVVENGQSAGIPCTQEEWNLLVEAFNPSTPITSDIKRRGLEEIRLNEDGSFMEFCDECKNRHLERERNKRFIYDLEWIYVKLKGDENEERDATKNAAALGGSVVTTRRLAAKKLLKWQMSSKETITDLKMRIFEQLGQSPADQLLYLNGRALEDNDTLESARVEPHNDQNPIILIVQQIVADVAAAAAAAQNGLQNGGSTTGGGGEPRQLERGFKNTALSS